MKDRQIEIPLPAPTCRVYRSRQRRLRAKWWFSQMRAAVNAAPDQTPQGELGGQPMQIAIAFDN